MQSLRIYLFGLPRLEISRDLDNVRAAWRQAIEGGDLTSLREAVEPLWMFSEIRLHEGEEAFRSAWRALAGVTAAPVASTARERGRVWDWRLAAEESRVRLEK